MKRQQATVGAFLKVPFEDTYHTYARILGRGTAFYDSRTNEEIADLNLIASKPILFIIAVYKDVITSGAWPKVGKLPLSEELIVLPMKFIQDAITKVDFELYDPNTGTITPTTKDKCKGLERAAVWDKEHVEERLRSHYAGKQSVYLREDRELFSE
jgi:hypothetical protein